LSPLDWWGVAWASLPVAACMILLAVQRLGQVRPMAIAIARMVVQLWLLGLVLGAVFRAENPWLVMATASVMLAVASHTVGARQGKSRWLIRGEALVSMALGIVVPMGVSVTIALHLQPWYRPETFIPLLGMILGNSVTSVSVAAERLASELTADRDLVEVRLALGATARQAAMPALRSAVRTGLTPIINNMAIVGVVSIPGMMSGQLLAGSDLAQAIRYQIMIYLAIAATATISTLILLEIRLRRYFTAAHQLREDS
jgi:putative ABC transport system permease protein